MTECQVCHEEKTCFDWDGWAICHDCYDEGLSCEDVDSCVVGLKARIAEADALLRRAGERKS